MYDIVMYVIKKNSKKKNKQTKIVSTPLFNKTILKTLI
jgi:hypothetical protein